MTRRRVSDRVETVDGNDVTFAVTVESDAVTDDDAVEAAAEAGADAVRQVIEDVGETDE